MVDFKDTIRRNPFRGEHIYHERKDWSIKCWFIKNFFLSHRCAAYHGNHFVIEYLVEIKAKFKNTLACLSGAQMGLNYEKNGGRKSLETLPLMTKWFVIKQGNFFFVISHKGFCYYNVVCQNVLYVVN